MFFAHSIHTHLAENRLKKKKKNSGLHFIGYFYFKMFRSSFKSTMEQEVSWVIVVVWLLTKHTEWTVCGDKRPSTLLDRYNDRSALIFIVTVPGAWRHVSTASDLGPSWWCKRWPLEQTSCLEKTARDSWQAQWSLSEVWIVCQKELVLEIKSLIPLYVNWDLMSVLSPWPTCRKQMCWFPKCPQQ